MKCAFMALKANLAVVGAAFFFVLLEWSLWDKHILKAMLGKHFIRHTLKEIEVPQMKNTVHTFIPSDLS